MSDKLQKHTLNLRKGDWDYITGVYQHTGRPTSDIVRQIVSRFVDTLKKAEGNERPSPNIGVKL